jgi:hypothetical protein
MTSKEFIRVIEIVAYIAIGVVVGGVTILIMFALNIIES